MVGTEPSNSKGTDNPNIYANTFKQKGAGVGGSRPSYKRLLPQSPIAG